MKHRILKNDDLYLYDYFIYPNLIQSVLKRKQGIVYNLVDNNAIVLSWGLSLIIGGEFSQENGDQVVALLKTLSSPRYIYVPDSNWEDFIINKLTNRAQKKQINSYIFDVKRYVNCIKDENIMQITPDFMKSNLHNLQCIIDELYSYTNLEDFFQNGVGVALVINNEVVGFCLSEYSLKDSLGANIWIDDRFQGFGYAKKLTNAFLLSCQRKNKNVYWVCNEENFRSNKVAKSTEFIFEKSDNYLEI